MKFTSLSCCLLALLLGCQQAPPPTGQQEAGTNAVLSDMPAVDTSLFETFEYKDGDTTYLMKKYFICFLKTGPSRSHPKEEAAKLQEQHLAHISQLAENKQICMAGPFESQGDIRGILIFSVPSLAIADSLAHLDPSVQAGRLSVELHPWWAAVGSRLF